VGPLAIGLRTPAALALGISSVAQLGGRPAHLALGASTPVVVSGWHGRSWQPQTMTAAMRETAELTRQILAGQRSGHDGAHASSHGFRLAAGPQQTSITVAAFAPAMLSLAARIADRVVVNLVTPAQARAFRRSIDAHARQAGLAAAPPLAAWIPVAIDPDDDAYAQLARQLVVYLAPPGYGEMFIEAGFADLVARARDGQHPRELMSAIPHELVHAIGAVGDAQQVSRRLQEYAAAGVDEIGIVPVTANDPGAQRLLGEAAAVLAGEPISSPARRA